MPQQGEIPSNEHFNPVQNQEAGNVAGPLVQEEPPQNGNAEANVGQQNLEGNGQNVHPVQADENVIQPANVENIEQADSDADIVEYSASSSDENMEQDPPEPQHFENANVSAAENNGIAQATDNSLNSGSGNPEGAINLIAAVGGQLASTEDTDANGATGIIEMLVMPSSSTGGLLSMSEQLMTPGWSTNEESTTGVTEMLVTPILPDAGVSVSSRSTGSGMSEQLMTPVWSTNEESITGVTEMLVTPILPDAGVSVSSRSGSGNDVTSELPGNIPISGEPISVTASVMGPRSRHSGGDDVGVASSMAAEGIVAAATALPPFQQSRLHISVASQKYNATFFSVEFNTIRSKVSFSKKDILVVGCSDGLLSDPIYFVKCNNVLCLELDRNKINRAYTSNTTMPENFSIRRADVRHDVMEFKADILINNFVFNRYETKEDIEKIANFCFGTLKPGKTCYILLRNSKSTTFWGDSLRKYGITFTDREEMSSGFKTRVIKFTDLRETNCVHYCFNINFYITALEEAGFVNVEELPLRYEKLRSFDPPNFWEDLKANPHQVILMAEKLPEAAVDTAQFEDV